MTYIGYGMPIEGYYRREEEEEEEEEYRSALSCRQLMHMM